MSLLSGYSRVHKYVSMLSPCSHLELLNCFNNVMKYRERYQWWATVWKDRATSFDAFSSGRRNLRARYLYSALRSPEDCVGRISLYKTMRSLLLHLSRADSLSFTLFGKSAQSKFKENPKGNSFRVQKVYSLRVCLKRHIFIWRMSYLVLPRAPYCEGTGGHINPIMDTFSFLK